MNVKEIIKKYKVPAAGGLAAVLFWLYGLVEGEEIPLSEKHPAIEQIPQETSLSPSKDKEVLPVEVAVDIKGAVAVPGIYIMASNKRVNDVIAKAGGLTAQADTAAINLAQKVQDEMVVYVPKRGEAIPESFLPSANTAHAADGAPASGTAEEKALIDINTADSTGLQELPGIGESKAQAIIDYRETEGPFAAVEELKNVTGIGDKTFEKLAPLIRVQ